MKMSMFFMWEDREYLRTKEYIVVNWFIVK